MASVLTVKHYKGRFKTIAGMNSEYTYGRNTWEAFKQILRRYGIQFQVVAERWPKVGATASDLAPHVEALKQAAPDIVFSAMSFADLPDFLIQAHAAGLSDHSKYVLPEGGWQINRFSKAILPGGVDTWVQHVVFREPGRLGAAKEFVSYYSDRYKEVPRSEADRAYFAFSAYKSGVETAYKHLSRWPKPEEIIDVIPGREIEGLGGMGRYRSDKIAEQTFIKA